MAETMCVGYQALVNIIVISRLYGISESSLSLSFPSYITTGLFIYSSGCIVIIEDLSNSKQRHLTGK